MSYALKPIACVLDREDAWQGAGPIRQVLAADWAVCGPLVLDAYPGVDERALYEQFVAPLHPEVSISMAGLMKSPAELDAMLQDALGDDRVLGRMTRFDMEAFFDPAKLRAARNQLASGRKVAVYGPGASLLTEGGLRVYADITRWEIQLRFRAGMPNWGADNADEDILRKYKRGFFAEWRVNDAHKIARFDSFRYIVDANNSNDPKMASSGAVREALRKCTTRPFRVVPFFDPGVWGGHWMQQKFGLPDGVPNYAWCFDCVPEENGLILQFGHVQLELPVMDLTLLEPTALLGEYVYHRFGAEFPIRFDLLDTMGGQNLSLQVHPKLEYIRSQFKMAYTQDESYYILEAAEDAVVYLGLKPGAKVPELVDALTQAQQTAEFDAERYINAIPAKKHDHFLIPAGTLHGAGANTVVLEISATPYIFTFKLWDWGRLGLDGKPRPIHLAHGAPNIDPTRDLDWVLANCCNRFEPVTDCEERTGLHPLEFIETRRHTFSGSVDVEDIGGVQVMNLVFGGKITVRSPNGIFEPFTVHYAETFILPAGAHGCVLTSFDGETVIVIRAYVRKEAISDVSGI